MPWHALANELVLLVADHLPSERDINALARASPALHQLLNPYLYHHRLRLGSGSVLLWAASRGQRGTLALFLDAGAPLPLQNDPPAANPDQQQRQGPRGRFDAYRSDHPLCCAARHGHADVVGFLLDRGVQPDVTDPRGFTSLLLAAQDGQLASVRTLLAYGADPTIGTDWGSLPVGRAARHGHQAVVELLLAAIEEKYPHALVSNQNQALLWAAHGGHVSIIELLLRRKVDPNVREESFHTPLLYAAENGHAEATFVLLQHGASPRICTLDGESPLILAALNGHDSVMQVLLAVCPLGSDGERAMVNAATKGYAGVVQLLLTNGVPTDCKDHRFERTPLSRAAERGQLSVVKLLLASGADATASDRLGRTPLMWATAKNHHGVVAKLKHHIASEGQNT